jgi:hypothetical protein
LHEVKNLLLSTAIGSILLLPGCILPQKPEKLLLRTPSQSIISEKSVRDNIVCLGEGYLGDLGVSKTKNGDLMFWLPDLDMAVTVNPLPSGSRADIYFGPRAWYSGPKEKFLAAVEKCK